MGVVGVDVWWGKCGDGKGVGGCVVGEVCGARCGRAGVRGKVWW